MSVFGLYPDALMMAEDSSDRALMTAPIHDGGVGFNYKWNMGWMNDTLKYMERDPVYRKYHHYDLTFSMAYAYSENFVLPFSHDEVVHGKKSMLDKMPGDYWQKFAGLRALYGYQMAHPGKKLLFMGSELGMFSEWKDLEQVDWHLLEYDKHRQMYEFVKTLNHFYKDTNALWDQDYDPLGFEWIDADNRDQSIFKFARRGKNFEDVLVVISNFTPATYHGFRIGVPVAGTYIEAINSDLEQFGGSNQHNSGELLTEEIPAHRYGQSISITIPPLSTVIFKLIKLAE
jgi:1,4-alpha-glucan branching enzyme